MPTQELTSYKRTEIETATPLQLVVMLYDGAMDNLRLARRAIDAGDLEQKTQAVDRLLAILGELQSTLDMERGGDIAQNLNALYTYFCEQIVEASVKLDPVPLEHVLSLLAGIRSAWYEISQKSAQENQAAAGDGVAASPQPPHTRRVSVRT